MICNLSEIQIGLVVLYFYLLNLLTLLRAEYESWASKYSSYLVRAVHGLITCP